MQADRNSVKGQGNGGPSGSGGAISAGRVVGSARICRAHSIKPVHVLFCYFTNFLLSQIQSLSAVVGKA